MESNNSWIHPLKVLPGSMPHNTSVREEGLTDEKLDRAIAEDVGNKAGLLNAGKNQYPKDTEDGARLGADSDLLSDQRKRKAEADPSRGDTSLLLAGTLAGDRSSSSTVIMEVQNDMPTNPAYMHGSESTGKIEISMGVQKHEHHAVEPSDTPKLHTGHTNGSAGSEREPWAWKTSRPVQPSPVFSEHSRTGTGKICVPSRYIASVSCHPCVFQFQGMLSVMFLSVARNSITNILLCAGIGFQRARLIKSRNDSVIFF